MSNSLVLNSSNVFGQNNTFLYNFKNGNYKINDGEIAISSVTIPYSWFNVTSDYNNNTFQATWTVGITKTTYTITLPDGFYSVTDINNYYQQFCITNGFYLVNSSGLNVYYLNLSYNTNYYAVQLLTFPVPTSLPAGWSQPTNFAGYPASITCPQFILPSIGSISNIIGFTAGQTYGSGASTSQSFLSSFTPQGSVVNSIIMRCSIVNNFVCSPGDILDSIPITSSFGSNINYVPNFEKWIKLNNGTYNNLIITFYDQNFNILNIRDTNILITLLIRQK